MVGLIFGIIFLIAGIIAGVMLSRYSEKHWREDDYGNYVKDSTGNRIKDTIYPLRKFSWISYVAGIVLAFVCIISASTASIPTGYTGIQTVFGKVLDDNLDSGFHFKAPWVSVVKMDNRVQKAQVELLCFSSDIQEVSCQYTLNYQINRDTVQNLYKTVGVDYYETAVTPVVAESVKTIMARYTAEELVGSRDSLACEIEVLLKAELEKYSINVVSTAIEDLDFTDSFTDAVEAKQVADQKAKQAKIEQEQAKMEATYKKEIAEIEANAAAEVAKIQAQADMEVAKISADSSEYQGRKEAAIAMQRLASINGWTVIANEETGMNEIRNANGNPVTAEELKLGTENLIKYYYTQQWDGKLPETYMGDQSISGIILGE